MCVPLDLTECDLVFLHRVCHDLRDLHDDANQLSDLQQHVLPARAQLPEQLSRWFLG